jgi:hypothetical protein
MRILQFNTWKGERERIIQSYFYLVCVASTRHALMPTCLGLIWRTFETQIGEADLGQDVGDMSNTKGTQVHQLTVSKQQLSTKMMCKTLCTLKIETFQHTAEDQAPHFHCHSIVPEIQNNFVMVRDKCLKEALYPHAAWKSRDDMQNKDSKRVREKKRAVTLQRRVNEAAKLSRKGRKKNCMKPCDNVVTSRDMIRLNTRRS